MEILDSSSNRLNPLFIHSLSGLGKTHLLQAMLHEVRRRDDGRTAEYLSAETFTNQFIYAMRNNRLDAFRHRYRNVDILLIDDVHFLGNKSRLQEELLHTFDALHTGNRQFVLASDVHPKMLSKIKQNLVNRFASGMVVRMAPPDFSTRVAIMKIKLQQQARRLPEDVVRYVARGFEGSVRDLTGATTLILAYAGLTGEKIDVNLARTALTASAPRDGGAFGARRGRARRLAPLQPGRGGPAQAPADARRAAPAPALHVPGAQIHPDVLPRNRRALRRGQPQQRHQRRRPHRGDAEEGLRPGGTGLGDGRRDQEGMKTGFRPLFPVKNPLHSPRSGI